MSDRPTSASADAVTVVPLIHARVRPADVTSRLSTTRASSVSMPRVSNSSRSSERDAVSNTPSTVARSVPVRTTSAAPRSPSNKPSAPTMMDFPAPVSPVSTLNPGPSGSVSDSMIAKFLIRSSVSIPGLISFRNSPPAELLPQRGKEAGAGKPHDLDRALRPTDVERFSHSEGGADLAVDGDHKLFGRTVRLHGDTSAGGQHDGPYGQRVRGDRRHDQRLQRRHYDGATRGKTVR